MVSEVGSKQYLCDNSESAYMIIMESDAVEDVSSRHDCVWSNLRFQDEFHLPAFTLAPSHPTRFFTL